MRNKTTKVLRRCKHKRDCAKNGKNKVDKITKKCEDAISEMEKLLTL